MTLIILIVEDEREMVEILCRYLQPLSSRIDTTDDLPKAVEMAKRGKYNVVLLDLRLRTTGKEEAMESIREFKRHNAAVVVVSGIPEHDIRDQVMAAGADAFVPKDGSFCSRAVLMAANVATLHLPKESYQSNTYLKHVEMLRQMVDEETPS